MTDGRDNYLCSSALLGCPCCHSLVRAIWLDALEVGHSGHVLEPDVGENVFVWCPKTGDEAKAACRRTDKFGRPWLYRPGWGWVRTDWRKPAVRRP